MKDVIEFPYVFKPSQYPADHEAIVLILPVVRIDRDDSVPEALLRERRLRGRAWSAAFVDDAAFDDA